MTKRVVFFGVTGIDKRSAMQKLRSWAEVYRSREAIRIVDFESRYLFDPDRGGKTWYSFLDDEQERQRAIWKRAWQNFVTNELQAVAGTTNDLFVAIHGCIVRGHYGVRCIIDPRTVAETLEPDLVVTLLDDVYEMWWRTENRAAGEPWKGRPSVEQLLFARRAELMIADQVAFALESPIGRFMLSVSHPVETLGNRIYGQNPKVVYLCFPISAPRDLLQKNKDRSGEQEIMKFLQAAYERQQKNPNLAMVCPLGIDELPLIAPLADSSRGTGEDGDHEEKAIQFDSDRLRWDMSSIWGKELRLSVGTAPNQRTAIPASQLKAAVGMIHTDVGLRDYRLVEQADCLLAFNPKFRNREDISRSVREEIRFAAGRCPVYVVQEPKHDPSGVFDREYPQGGTMPQGPAAQMVVRKENLEAALDAVAELTRR